MRRENNFDAVRLLAAAAVIVGHSRPLTDTPDSILLGNSVQAIAVKIFFIVSGYLVCTSWSLHPSPVNYLIKRALRIFPALIVICSFTIFIVGPIFTTLPLEQYFGTTHTYAYLKNILMSPVYDLPGVFSSNLYPRAVNGSLWSLPIELTMYILLPVICMVDRAMSRNFAIIVGTLVVCSTSLYFVRVSPPLKHPILYGSDLISALDVAPYFLIGALIRQMKWDRLLDPVLALFFVGAAALLPPKSVVTCELVLYFILPYVVLTLAVSSHRLLRNAGRYGDFSYGLYLYGFLVQQCIVHLTNNDITADKNAALSLPIALAFAFLSWHFIEKPFLFLKPKNRKQT
jgi:peptidoglycan/LPS O-acetylase OafA/YrhL